MSPNVDEGRALLDTLLVALWGASYAERSQVAPPAPPTADLSIGLDGATLRIASSSWSEEGHLSMAHTVAERVWWRLGWSMLQGSHPGNSQLAVDRDRNAFYGEVAASLVAAACEWPEAERYTLLGMLRGADADGLGVLVEKHAFVLQPDSFQENEAFIEELFDGRRKASRLALLDRTAELSHDPRVLRRLRVVLEAAYLVAGCHWEDPYGVLQRSEPLLEAGLGSDVPVVREAARLLLDQMVRYAVNGGAYDVALPLLDRSVLLGPNFALQHLRRWRARLAMGLADAGSDWSVFADSVSKVAQLSGDPVWQLARDVMWIDGHIEAAHAAIAQRDGWPTAEVRRGRAKKAKPPKKSEAQRHEARRAQLLQEAVERVNELPDPFLLPLQFETRHVRVHGRSQFQSLFDALSS